MSTRRHRKPASPAKLAVHGAVITAALIASVLGGTSTAQAALDDATTEDPFRFFLGRLFPGAQDTGSAAATPGSATDAASDGVTSDAVSGATPPAAPELSVVPEATSSPDAPEAVTRQRLPLRPGMDLGDGDVIPPPDGDPDADPDPGSYSGGWSGDTAVTVYRFPYFETEVDSFNVKDGLRAAWNFGLRDLQTQLEQQIEAESGGKLYNVDVTLASADADSLLNLTVSPKWQSVSLFYLVGDHQMRAKVDADYVKNPTATMDFAIGLRLDLGTDTWPEEPLDLKSADAVVMPDANGVSVDGDWSYKVGTAVRWLKNLGNVDSVEQTISDSFTGRTSDVESSVQTPVDLLNGDLESLINGLGEPVSAITPRYDDETYRLVLRLDTRPTVHQSPDAVMAR
ncbi:hypothetical protein [Haloechinothrix halophila]|uniref:hypothetical protein n=1 Tax=Haloechinothrix halophila TaxID=1069073 RepID=UPI00041ABFC7|nr:hypothetical protein [Haloechinothrix halophila]